MFLKVVNGMTDQKILLVTVIAILLYNNVTEKSTQKEWMYQQVRSAEESRVSDRTHCDDREDKVRVFYGQQLEIQRKHDADREDRARVAQTAVTEALKLTFETRFEQLKTVLIAEIEKWTKKP